MLEAFSVTDIGKKRECNQDSLFLSAEPIGCLANLFIVADGMGGHKAGDYASRITVETMVEVARNTSHRTPSEIIKNAIDRANTRVYERSMESKDFEGMGTTVVAATYNEGTLCVANVGDSRLYLVRDDCEQITVDHSLVEEMIRLGVITRDQARNHPEKNKITRAVGVEREVSTDFYTVKLIKGDIVLMCTDGLTNMLEESRIFEIIKGEGKLEEKADRLVQAANDNGGLDNITVILAQVV